MRTCGGSMSKRQCRRDTSLAASLKKQSWARPTAHNVRSLKTNCCSSLGSLVAVRMTLPAMKPSSCKRLVPLASVVPAGQTAHSPTKQGGLAVDHVRYRHRDDRRRHTLTCHAAAPRLRVGLVFDA